MSHPTIARISTIFGLLILATVVGEQSYAQDKFNLTANVPGDASTTFLDIFSTTTRVHLDIPAGMNMPPGTQTDSTRTHTFLLARKVRRIKNEANVQTLEVVYLSAADLSSADLPSGADTVDLGTPLKGKTYQINCGSGDITLSPSSPTPISDTEAHLVKSECTDIERANALSQTFRDMKVGDSKALTASGVSLFTELLEKFDIRSWDVKLTTLEVGPPFRAAFELAAKADTTTQAGKSFPEYKGGLVISDKWLKEELNLTSSSVHVENLPDGKSQIVSKGELIVSLRREMMP